MLLPRTEAGLCSTPYIKRYTRTRSQYLRLSCLFFVFLVKLVFITRFTTLTINQKWPQTNGSCWRPVNHSNVCNFSQMLRLISTQQNFSSGLNFLLKLRATFFHVNKRFPVQLENSAEWKSAFRPKTTEKIEINRCQLDFIYQKRTVLPIMCKILFMLF